jgi:hypothetical protein
MVEVTKMKNQKLQKSRLAAHNILENKQWFKSDLLYTKTELHRQKD